MLQGYSIPEAASVLGVPEGKVWELLARGVLSGATEGESMRVYLTADAPATSRPEAGLPHRTNGNGGAGEASPFRELLTEFRNLTERYGQALLALGEARGEVAGLRSRVEMLEARLDLRLPGPGILPPVAWERPEPVATAHDKGPDEVAAAARLPDVAVAAPRPARKSRTARSAVAGFAEALARAQDPTTARVPDAAQPEEVAAEVATEAGVQPVELPELPEPEPPAWEAPTHVPLASEPGVAEEAAPEATAPGPEAPAGSTYSTDVVEPDWFADGDFAWLDAAEIGARDAAKDAAVEEVAAEPEATLPEADEGMETAPAAWHEPEPVPALQGEVQPMAVEVEAGAVSAAAPSPPNDDDLARLAREEGWDDAEVAAIRALVQHGEPRSISLPGADELDSALAALGAPSPGTMEASEPQPEAEAEAEPEPQEWPAADREWAKAPVMEDEAPPPAPQAESLPQARSKLAAEQPFPFRPAPPLFARPAPSAPAEPAWLRRRSGPAANAYRRLRRLFPG